MTEFGLEKVNAAIQWHPECEWIRRFAQNFHHFTAIHSVVRGKWKRSDTYLSLPTAYTYNLPALRKQEILYGIGKTATKCLMVGNRLCHAFLILLLSNPHLTIECLDINDPVVTYLNTHFNNRIQAYTGGTGHDLVHLDVDISEGPSVFATYIPLTERGKYILVNEHKQHFRALQPYIDTGKVVWVSSCESATVLVGNLHS